MPAPVNTRLRSPDRIFGPSHHILFAENYDALAARANVLLASGGAHDLVGFAAGAGLQGVTAQRRAFVDRAERLVPLI